MEIRETPFVLIARVMVKSDKVEEYIYNCTLYDFEIFYGVLENVHWTICLVRRVVEKHFTPFKLCECKLCMR